MSVLGLQKHSAKSVCVVAHSLLPSGAPAKHLNAPVLSLARLLVVSSALLSSLFASRAHRLRGVVDALVLVLVRPLAALRAVAVARAVVVVE